MGIEIEMEKKKLTDEEIVNALEDMASECETNFSASVVDLIHRQKAEIERLANANMQTIGKNDELLLKVDELKKRCEIAEGTKNRLTIFDRIAIQDKAVKDTAKEIFILAEDYNCGYESDIDNFMKELKERYGVEVE